MIKQIVFVATRNNKGATGGPGGVVYMLKEVIGTSINEHLNCFYRFNTFPSNRRIFQILNKIIFIIKALVEKHTFYVAHDIDAAKMLSFLNKPYSLVYHNQGPIVQESINFGKKLTHSQIEKIQITERIAFTKAVSLHFPSKGASDMYFNNQYRSVSLNEVKLGAPLYNTIPLSKITAIKEIQKDTNVTTFFSLGTLTQAKGQDQTVNFLEKLLMMSNKKIRYIVVGDGPMKDELINQCQKLEKQHQHFTYYYFSRLTHESVMYIHSIADVYIMLHRLSIFDFATLEAMNSHTAIILSPVGGNLDFNKKNNIIFAYGTYDEAILEYLKSDIQELKDKNQEVFNHYFSQTAFKQEYVNNILKDIKSL